MKLAILFTTAIPLVAWVSVRLGGIPPLQICAVFAVLIGALCLYVAAWDKIRTGRGVR